jgi:hypothetical protein
MMNTGREITITVDAGMLAGTLDQLWDGVCDSRHTSHTYDNLLRAAMAGGLRLQAGQTGAEQLRKGEF